MTYQASNEEHPIEIVNIASLDGGVKERMEKGAFGYIRGGSEDEWTMKENTSSFNKKTIMPRVLRGIDHAEYCFTRRSGERTHGKRCVWLYSRRF